MIRRMIQEEAASGWKLLRAVPSTFTWKAVDYVSGLPEATRAALFEAFSANSLFLFEPLPDPSLHAYKAEHPEYWAFVNALPGIWDWKYVGVRMLKMLARDPSRLSSKRFRNVPSAVAERARTIRPAKAAEIRVSLREAFVKRFDCRYKNLGGGTWLYQCVYGNQPFDVTVDYGKMAEQLHYEVAFESADSSLRARELSYERMLGFGFGEWDSVTADNLAEKTKLLCRLLIRLAELPERWRQS